MFKVNFKTPDGTVSTEAAYDFGATLADSIELFTEDVVKRIFDRQATTIARDKYRAWCEAAIEAGETEEVAIATANDKLNAWVLGQGPVRKSKEDKIEALMGDMSPEEKEAFLAKYLS